VVDRLCITHATAEFPSWRAVLGFDLIRTFGEAGLAATIIALLAVLSLVRVRCLVVRNEQTFAAKFKSADAGVTRYELLLLDRGAHGQPSWLSA